MEGGDEVLRRFDHDTRDHQMTVVRNDGASRHLQFRKPGSSAYWFDIITWPGSLCINGDMGTHVFSRTVDMFTFFRLDPKHPQHRINPSYWHEKLVAECRHGAKRFSHDKFGEAVYHHFESFCEGHEDLTEDEVLWLAGELQDAVGRASNQHEAYDVICNFSHEIRRERRNLFGSVIQRGLEFCFQDFESSVDDYTFGFLWCLYAIVWAIECFDSWEEETAEAAIAAKIAAVEVGLDGNGLAIEG